MQNVGRHLASPAATTSIPLHPKVVAPRKQHLPRYRGGFFVVAGCSFLGPITQALGQLPKQGIYQAGAKKG